MCLLACCCKTHVSSNIASCIRPPAARNTAGVVGPNSTGKSRDFQLGLFLILGLVVVVSGNHKAVSQVHQAVFGASQNRIVRIYTEIEGYKYYLCTMYHHTKHGTFGELTLEDAFMHTGPTMGQGNCQSNFTVKYTKGKLRISTMSPNSTNHAVFFESDTSSQELDIIPNEPFVNQSSFQTDNRNQQQNVSKNMCRQYITGYLRTMSLDDIYFNKACYQHDDFEFEYLQCPDAVNITLEDLPEFRIRLDKDAIYVTDNGRTVDVIRKRGLFRSVLRTVRPTENSNRGSKLGSLLMGSCDTKKRLKNILSQLKKLNSRLEENFKLFIKTEVTMFRFESASLPPG